MFRFLAYTAFAIALPALANKPTKVTLSCAEDFARLAKARFSVTTSHLIDSLTEGVPRYDASKGEAPPPNETDDRGEEPPVRFTLTLPLSEAGMSGIELQKARAAAQDCRAAHCLSFFVGFQAFSRGEDANSPMGVVLELPFPTPWGNIPMHVPAVGQYQRFDPNVPGAHRTQSGPEPKDAVLAEYRRMLASTERLRQFWGKNGYAHLYSVQYTMRVGNGVAEGKVKQVESFTGKIAPGKLDETLAALSAQERAAAEILVQEGHSVTALRANEIEGQRTADLKVASDTEERTIEVKSPTDDSTGVVDSETVKNRVWSSLRGGGQSPNIIIDARQSGLTLEEAQRSGFRLMGLLKQPQYARFRDRLSTLRILGLEDGARFDLHFDFQPLL